MTTTDTNHADMLRLDPSTDDTVDTVDPTDGWNPDPTDGYDFYREIHKGIRLAMFELVIDSGRLDVGDPDKVDRLLVAHRELFELLDMHHHHEDTFIQPLIVQHAPVLARVIQIQHGDVHDGIDHLRTLGARLATSGRERRSVAAHRLYLDLSELTGVYLDHQLVEENSVMPALRSAVPTEELIALDQSIRAGLSPDAMATVLRLVLSSMNFDEQYELAMGMSMAPPEVFAGFRAIAASTLPADDWARLLERLNPV